MVIATTSFLYPCPVEGCEKGYDNKKKLQAHFNFSHRDLKLSTNNIQFAADEMSPEERRAATGADAEEETPPQGGVSGTPTPEQKTRQRVAETIERSTVIQPPNTLREVPDDPTTLTDPRDQVEAVARQLGIGPASASAMANYIARSYDLDNPEAVWRALQECTEVSPSQRKRFWRTWLSYRGTAVPETLARQVEEVVRRAEGKPVDSALEERLEKPRRLYVALNGEVHPTDDDEVGLSWAQAMQAANLQAERLTEKAARQSQQGGDSSVVSELIKQQGENTRAVLEAIRSTQPKETGGGVKEILEVAKEMSSSQLATMRAETEGKFALIQEQMKNNNDKLAASLDKLADAVRGGEKKEKGFFDEAFEKLPGLKDAMTSFFDPQSRGKASDNITVKLVGADGQPQELTLDAYERLEGIRTRKEAVTMVREGLPQLLDVGSKLAQAFRRAGGDESGGQEQPELQAGEQAAKVQCVACHVPFTFRPGANVVQCPACGELQTPDGRKVTMQVEAPAVRPAPANGRQAVPATAQTPPATSNGN